jgi:hypothetical protein
MFILNTLFYWGIVASVKEGSVSCCQLMPFLQLRLLISDVLQPLSVVLAPTLLFSEYNRVPISDHYSSIFLILLLFGFIFSFQSKLDQLLIVRLFVFLQISEYVCSQRRPPFLNVWFWIVWSIKRIRERKRWLSQCFFHFTCYLKVLLTWYLWNVKCLLVPDEGFHGKLSLYMASYC